MSGGIKVGDNMFIGEYRLIEIFTMSGPLKKLGEIHLEESVTAMNLLNEQVLMVG